MLLLTAAVLVASTLVSPQVSGPFPVGTFDAHLVDPARLDPFQPVKNREMMVTISYPARRAGQQAPWLAPGLAAATDPILSSPAFRREPSTGPARGGRPVWTLPLYRAGGRWQVDDSPATMKKVIDTRVAGLQWSVPQIPEVIRGSAWCGDVRRSNTVAR